MDYDYTIWFKLISKMKKKHLKISQEHLPFASTALLSLGCQGEYTFALAFLGLLFLLLSIGWNLKKGMYRYWVDLIVIRIIDKITYLDICVIQVWFEKIVKVFQVKEKCS